MTRAVAAGAVALTILAGCGSDSPERVATAPPDESVVLGTDALTTPTETERARPRPKRKAKPVKPAPTAPAPRQPGRVTMIGDSLAVGTQTLLPAALPGWTVRTNARKGRPIGEGAQVLRDADVPMGSVLAFSLFTNDPPGATAALETALRAGAAKVGPEGCQVWATIVRPAGAGGEPANDVLRRLDGGQVDGARVVVADWAALVARRPSLLAGDGVHGTPEGYRARARLYADAVRRCP